MGLKWILASKIIVDLLQTERKLNIRIERTRLNASLLLLINLRRIKPHAIKLGATIMMPWKVICQARVPKINILIYMQILPTHLI